MGINLAALPSKKLKSFLRNQTGDFTEKTLSLKEINLSFSS